MEVHWSCRHRSASKLERALFMCRRRRYDAPVLLRVSNAPVQRSLTLRVRGCEEIGDQVEPAPSTAAAAAHGEFGFALRVSFVIDTVHAIISLIVGRKIDKCLQSGVFFLTVFFFYVSHEKHFK